MSKKTTLVIGSSGTVGSELVRLLESAGQEVRKTTHRKEAAQGSNQVYLNLASGEGLQDAFAGVSSAFLLSPPGFADQYAMLSPLIQHAKAQSLKKVVLMSAMGANAVETSPFRRAEIELEKSGLAYNIIRPNWFLQNFNTFWIQGILEQNKILLPAGTAKVSFIDARDIAAVAAKLLLSNEFNNRAFDLTGPLAVDHSEVASAISKVTGKQISYTEIAPEELRKVLLGAGLPGDYIEFLLMIFGFLREGYSAAINENVKLITAHSARTLHTYVSDYKQSWL